MGELSSPQLHYSKTMKPFKTIDKLWEEARAAFIFDAQLREELLVMVVESKCRGAELTPDAARGVVNALLAMGNNYAYHACDKLKLEYMHYDALDLVENIFDDLRNEARKIAAVLAAGERARHV